MLRVVTKEDYWRADQALGRRDELRRVLRKLRYAFGLSPFDWSVFSIKDIQDAVLLHALSDVSGKDVLEIGGGHSRTLQSLARRNRCTNLDPLEGSGHGPVRKPLLAPYRHVVGAIGESAGALPDGAFDVVYSISVLEHIGDPDIPGAFADMARLLRPGGRMAHLVDVYLGASEDANAEARRRCALYRSSMEAAGLAPSTPDEVIAPEDLGFLPSYASNPDNVMGQWNAASPSLRPMRAAAQACSLLIQARRA